MDEAEYEYEILRRTVLAVMQWVYVHPNQEEAAEILDSVPNSFEERMPRLKELGIVTAETYKGLI